MKLGGIVLILFSAGYGYLIYRRSMLCTLRLLREIAEDLQLLAYRICVQRCPLSVILTEDLGRGVSGAYLWTPLAVRIARADGSLDDCWNRTMDELSPLIAQRLLPLGKLLPIGGETLVGAIEEVRKELLRLAREQQEQQMIKLRLSAALCFSAAALFVLVIV